jgi:hypothetical protein
MSDPVALLDRQIELGNFLVAGWPALDIPGMPRVSAAAAVGNATQENNCLSVTLGALDHGSNGLFQWRLDRLTNCQAFGVRCFGLWGAIEPQAAFFSYECKGGYAGLWNDLVAGTKSLATLTANICDIYEVPAAASAALDQRIAYATAFLAAWPIVVPTPAPAPIIVAPPAPVVVLNPAPIPATALTVGPLAVIEALANAILASQNPLVIRALAAAILNQT